MTLSSMTGFARADGADGDFRWHWEVRSVNGKGLDARSRLPAGYERLEVEVRAAVARHLNRGNCQIGLQIDRTDGGTELVVNEAALERVLAVVERLRGRVEAAPPRLDGLLALRGVLELADTEEDEAARERRDGLMIETLNEALAALVAARASEGAELERVLGEQIDTIERLARDARDCPAATPEAIRARLEDQIARLMDTGAGLDADRLHQEAMLLAARADITEEIDRLLAHIEAARALMAGNGPAGRRLDFLAQEFNREANTICSKSNDRALTAIGLELKAVIDRMREQVQNIE